MAMETEKTDKTTEQKQASKLRYLAQEDTATQKLTNADCLYEYIDGLKYAYSLSMRYHKNLKNFVTNCGQGDRLEFLNKCLKAGILTPWKDTYYFNKDKADSLQLYLKEHNRDFFNPFKTEIPNESFQNKVH
jgi:hypothetical protein